MFGFSVVPFFFLFYKFGWGIYKKLDEDTVKGGIAGSVRITK